jgi:hypothetical protein
MTRVAETLALKRVEEAIHFLRGQRVMLDFDLAALYGVETRVFNQAVKRNMDRFPADFMFQLSAAEMALVIQARRQMPASANSSQFVTSYQKHRGSGYPYYAFTEQGVAMLSSVLHSPRAVRVNIEIMRAFVKLRQMLASSAELSRRLDALERKYDRKFKIVFDAIRELMRDEEAEKPKREIGFHASLSAANLKTKRPQ